MTRPLWRMLRLARGQRRRLALSVVLGALAIGCGVGLMSASGYLIARAAEHPRITALSVAIVAVRAFGVGRGCFRYSERLASHDVALRALARARTNVYQRLERIAPAGVRQLRGGDLLSRLVTDVDAIQDLFVRGIGPPLVAAAAGGGTVVLLLLIFAPGAAVLALGLTVGGLVLPASVATLSHRTAVSSAGERTELADGLVDLITGGPDLLAFGADQAALTEFERHDSRLRRLAGRRATVEAIGAGGAQLTAGLTVWLVLLLGVRGVAGGTLHRVPLAVAVLAALATFEAVNPLPAAATALVSARASARRLFEVLDTQDPLHEPAVPTRPRRPGSAPHIVLRGVGVRYADDAPWALDGVDLDLSPGRRVAVVGSSGAGKSSLAALLFRFRDPDAGHVELDGMPLSSYAESDIRRVISGVPQDPHVFATTLAENLRLAKPGATSAELEQAAAGAHLLDWIETLPAGWNTYVGDRGSQISGGERQRLALARALLAAPAVMVLDEPTAHLDAETRAALTADILAAVGGHTTVLITHDLDGLDDVDEILVLERGRVIERGTHRALTAAAGTYRQLRSLQA